METYQTEAVLHRDTHLVVDLSRDTFDTTATSETT